SRRALQETYVANPARNSVKNFAPFLSFGCPDPSRRKTLPTKERATAWFTFSAQPMVIMGICLRSDNQMRTAVGVCLTADAMRSLDGVGCAHELKTEISGG